MQSRQVTRYLTVPSAETAESELEYLDRTAKDENVVSWAVCIVEDGVERPVGTTSLHVGHPKPYIAESGFVIYDPSFWKKGIASLAHLARAHYAVEVLDLSAIRSGAVQDNLGSIRALEKTGYVQTGTIFHHDVIDGKVCHATQLLWVNSNQRNWKYFWGASEIPEEFSEARRRTRRVLRQAQACVEFI
jgi:RimJ/RimL family protein N-acetyltransferase